MKKPVGILCGVLLSAVCALETAWANEAVLYADEPPEDAAFLRVVASVSTLPKEIHFGGRDLSSAPFADGEYVAISAAGLTGVAPGSYATLTLDGTGAENLFHDPNPLTGAKVQITLLNGDAEQVRLVVPGRDLEVIGAVGPMGVGQRVVNPVSSAFAVVRESDGQSLGSFELRLRRGQNLGFLVRGGQVSLVETRFGPVYSEK